MENFKSVLISPKCTCSLLIFFLNWVSNFIFVDVLCAISLRTVIMKNLGEKDMKKEQ